MSRVGEKMKKLNLYEAIQKLKSMPYEEWLTVLNNFLSNQSDSRLPLKNEKHIFYIMDYIQNAKHYEEELWEIFRKSENEYQCYENNKRIEEFAKHHQHIEEDIKPSSENDKIPKMKDFFLRIFISIITSFLTAVLWNLLFSK